jgi:hypothetical protein
MLPTGAESHCSHPYVAGMRCSNKMHQSQNIAHGEVVDQREVGLWPARNSERYNSLLSPVR